MNFYLVRHGESVANEQGLVCGQMDFPLTEKGVQQARKLREYFASNNIMFDNYGSTSLLRAKRTLQEISPDTQPEIHDELLETDTGIYSDWKLENYLSEIDGRISKHGLYPEVKFHGGESLNDMVSRCASWLNKIKKIQIYTKSNTLIVAHGGPIGALAHLIEKRNIQDFNAYSLNNCGFIHIHLDENKHFVLRNVCKM